MQLKVMRNYMGLMQYNTTIVPLSATQSAATLHAGQGAGKFNFVKYIMPMRQRPHLMQLHALVQLNALMPQHLDCLKRRCKLRILQNY